MFVLSEFKRTPHTNRVFLTHSTSSVFSPQDRASSSIPFFAVCLRRRAAISCQRWHRRQVRRHRGAGVGAQTRSRRRVRPCSVASACRVAKPRQPSCGSRDLNLAVRVSRDSASRTMKTRPRPPGPCCLGPPGAPGPWATGPAEGSRCGRAAGARRTGCTRRALRSQLVCSALARTARCALARPRDPSSESNPSLYRPPIPSSYTVLLYRPRDPPRA